MRKILLSALMLTSVAYAQQSKKALFDETMSNATYDKSVWTVDSKGVMTASEDDAIWTTGEYENFELSLEFKNDTDTNSGVVVYCTDRKDWIPNSVEIQIADDYGKWSKDHPHCQCAAIYGHLAANEQKVVKEPGKWNKMVVLCQGQSIKVKLNGKWVTDMDMTKWVSGTENPDGSKIPAWLPKPFSQIPTKGYIGFQGKHGDATVWFRNITIKEL